MTRAQARYWYALGSGGMMSADEDESFAYMWDLHQAAAMSPAVVTGVDYETGWITVDSLLDFDVDNPPTPSWLSESPSEPSGYEVGPGEPTSENVAEKGLGCAVDDLTVAPPSEVEDVK